MMFNLVNPMGVCDEEGIYRKDAEVAQRKTFNNEKLPLPSEGAGWGEGDFIIKLFIHRKDVKYRIIGEKNIKLQLQLKQS
jgi:hypothetical protein